MIEILVQFGLNIENFYMRLRKYNICSSKTEQKLIHPEHDHSPILSAI